MQFLGDICGKWVDALSRGIRTLPYHELVPKRKILRYNLTNTKGIFIMFVLKSTTKNLNYSGILQRDSTEDYMALHDRD
jgi:hypothetical protein